MVGQVTDVDHNKYPAYGRALGDTTYGSIDVHWKCSSAEGPFDPAYYNGGRAMYGGSYVGTECFKGFGKEPIRAGPLIGVEGIER